MRPVAEWFAGAGLAAAPGNLFFFGDFHEHRPHTGGPMGAITEWLAFREAAVAPDITPRFDAHYKGMIVFVHWVKVLGLLTDTTLMGLPKLSIWPMNKQLTILLSYI